MDKYTFTKKELIKAFNRWNEDFLNDSNNFEIETTLNSGEEQANTLLEYLNDKDRN